LKTLFGGGNILGISHPKALLHTASSPATAAVPSAACTRNVNTCEPASTASDRRIFRLPFGIETVFPSSLAPIDSAALACARLLTCFETIGARMCAAAGCVWATSADGLNALAAARLQANNSPTDLSIRFENETRM